MGNDVFTFYGWRISLLVLVFYLLWFPGTAAEEGTGLPDEIVLHAIIPVSDDLSEYNVEAKTVLSLAVEDMNSVYQDTGSDTIVRLNITESTSDPESVLAAVKQLHESGVHMILVYFTSTQLTAVKPYADANDLLILSSGSSATSLTIPDDNILRFNPDDSSQDIVINYLLDQANITEIVPLVRDDLFGNFVNFSVREKKMNHTNLNDIVRYDPGSKEFDKVLARLDQQVGRLLEEDDKEFVGILAFTFSEIVPILQEASDGKYSNLSLVRWFGTDMNALKPDRIKSQAALRYGSDRMFTGYVLNLTDNVLDPSVSGRLVRKLGFEPNGLAYALYDTANIATEALSLHGSDNATALKKVVTDISTSYYGMLGHGALNAAGDREAAYYGLWRLEKDATGTCIWKNLGQVVRLNNQSNPIFYTG